MDITKQAEKLTGILLVKEATDQAIKSAGLIKLADNKWMAPLVGAGLGGIGGGIGGYLSSSDSDTDAKTRRKALIGALLGAGGGVLGGLGYNKLRGAVPVDETKPEDIKRTNILLDTDKAGPKLNPKTEPPVISGRPEHPITDTVAVGQLASKKLGKPSVARNTMRELRKNLLSTTPETTGLTEELAKRTGPMKSTLNGMVVPAARLAKITNDLETIRKTTENAGILGRAGAELKYQMPVLDKIWNGAGHIAAPARVGTGALEDMFGRRNLYETAVNKGLGKGVSTRSLGQKLLAGAGILDALAPTLGNLTSNVYIPGMHNRR